MRFRVLGPLQVGGTAIEARQERLVLALLLLRRGRTTSIDQMIDALWPERAPASAVNTARSKVSRLRKIVPEIESATGGFVLAPSHGDVDADVFEQRCAQAEGVDPDTAVDLLTSALSLWRGASAFPELEEAPIDRGPIVRLEEIRNAAQLSLARALLASGRRTTAAVEAERFLQSDPYRDGLWDVLIRALALDGRRVDALRGFQRYVARMEQAGLPPSVPLVELEREIVSRGTPVPDAPLVTSVRLDVPMVGRDAVLDDVRARIDSAVERGEASVVVVSGGAGMGKSRVVREALRGIAGSGRVAVGLGAFDPEGSMPLRALEDACAPLLVPGARLVDALVLSSMERRQHSELPSRAIVDDMLDRAATRPSVLVIEDLHWADRTSLELLATLVVELGRRAQVGAHQPLVVILSTRPDAPASRVVLARLERQPSVVTHDLGRLDELALFQLVHHTTGSRPAPDFVGRLSAITGGNPLLVLATLRRACADGELRLIDGRVDLAGRINVVLPRDVEEAVARLVDLVPAPTADLLARCASLGRVAELPAVAALADRSAREVMFGLVPAERLGIVAVDEQWVTFHHELFRRHLLDRLTDDESAELDAAAASALQHLDASDPAAVSADHVVRVARHLLGAARRVDPRRLIAVAEQAGDVVFASASWGEAARLYDASIDARRQLVGADPSPELLLRAGLAHFRHHDAAIAVARLDAAMDAARRVGDLRTEGTALLVRQRIALTIDDRGVTVREAMYHDFLAAAGDSVHDLRAEIYAQMAEYAFAVRRHADGQRWAAAAAAVAARAGDVDTSSLATMTAIGEGVSYLGMLELDAASASFDRAWANADPGDLWYRCAIAARHGMVALLHDDNSADAWLRVAHELGERAQNWSELSLASALAAMRDLAAEDPLAAVTNGRQSLAYYARSSYAFAPDVVYPAMMAAHARLGDAARAAAELRNWEAQRGRPSPLFRLLLAVETGDRELLASEIADRPLQSLLGGDVDIARMARPAVVALAAMMLDDTATIAIALDELNALLDRGVRRVLSWPLDIADVAARARAALGD